MKKLKFETKIYKEVDYHDLEQFIFEIYGEQYESVAEEEWNNYSSHEFNVKKQVDFDKDKTIDIFDGGVHEILQNLVNRDLIEEGNYLISVSW